MSAPATRWFHRAVRSRPGIALISSLVTAGLVVGIGVASGGIPGGDGVIHGCYNRVNGVLRVIDADKQNCRETEVPLSWNQQGPAGLSTTVLCPGCELAEADLQGAILPGAFLRNSAITLTMLADANLQGANLTGLIGEGASLQGANLIGSDFSGASLARIVFDGVKISDSIFTGAQLIDSSFEIAVGGQITLTQTTAWGSSFSGARLTDADFSNSVITDTLWVDAELIRPNFTGANLLGAVGLGAAMLVEPIWNNTICPDGVNSDLVGGTCEGHFTPTVGVD